MVFGIYREIYSPTKAYIREYVQPNSAVSSLARYLLYSGYSVVVKERRGPFPTNTVWASFLLAIGLVLVKRKVFVSWVKARISTTLTNVFHWSQPLAVLDLLEIITLNKLHFQGLEILSTIKGT